ncbi:MAG: BMP family ABC transporter substrate-binding protein [Lachnospiraceae bacterium]|nr:BMP family ABC transporter substrate-binding protein [Lachnospiraceae bacterium]
MKRRFAALFAAAALLAGLIGCGTDPNAPRYAFVADSSGVEEGINAAIWGVIEAQAEPNEYNTASFCPEEDTEEALTAVFTEAVKSRARLVLAFGEQMETPVFSAAQEHKKTKFVLVGGEPRQEAGGEVSIGENVLAVDLAYEQEGFAAGYASVKNGFRSLAVMAGEKNERNIRLINGFVQGAAAAASELGLEEGTVFIKAEYTGSDKLSPLRMSEALDFYGEGVESIFTTSGGIGTAVARAAEIEQKTFFTAGENLTEEEPSCLMSFYTQFENAFIPAIELFESKEGLPGGTMLQYGLKEECFAAAVDYSRFSSFTEADYQTLVEKLSNGDYVTDKEAESSGAVVYEELSSGRASSGGASSGVSSFEESSSEESEADNKV